ncbi:hypothetical protein AJ79_06038 [Helicocarpus griseus UAMH5409]|uniref:JmjC domain-containing protein n=1 Tax=Helicocarpus griseus UAMH5409 TaxID=1447875 RepID=A0A2B7XHS3_9EURO|nr:hypothetical protein AJ79_06038 [Helicocarpus griseus UAMH5409]
MRRAFSASAVSKNILQPRFSPLTTLPSSDISVFRTSHFQPQLPVVLPRGHFRHLPAIQKWFSQPPSSPGANAASHGRYLNYSYLENHGDSSVPLELTTQSPSSSPASPETPAFQRTYAPLALFLEWTKTATTAPTSTTATSDAKTADPNIRLYLAQCQLLDLPQALRSDFPTPSFVSEAGKGDIYDTNIWMGVPPTYTPLHRDPNPNLFVQMAGSKVVRLYAPETGRAVFERVRGMVAERRGGNNGDGGNVSAKFRGEEMMQGLEKELLEVEVWGDTMNREVNGGGDTGVKGFEAHLDAGDGIFIPMGWWHSIKGVREGITASEPIRRSIGGFDDDKALLGAQRIIRAAAKQSTPSDAIMM